MSLGVAIVGAGFIGQKRARARAGARLVACADAVPARAEALARTVSEAVGFADWREAICAPGVAVVVVSTLHDSLAEIAGAAIDAGRHVLVEKPAGRHSAEIEHL